MWIAHLNVCAIIKCYTRLRNVDISPIRFLVRVVLLVLSDMTLKSFVVLFPASPLLCKEWSMPGAVPCPILASVAVSRL